MLTISSMSRNAYMTFQLAQKNSDVANALGSVNRQTQTLFGSGGQNFGLFSSSGDTLQKLQSAVSDQVAKQQNSIAKLEDYAKTSKAFYSGFFDKTNALKDSSSTLSGADFTAENSGEVVGAAKQFAADYNDAAAFLGDNAQLSAPIKNLADSFASAKYSSLSLDRVGIGVDDKGRLSVDEAKLTAALTKNADKVQSVLGEKGLAGKTGKKVAAAVSHSDKLMPLPSLTKGASNMPQGILLDLFI